MSQETEQVLTAVLETLRQGQPAALLTVVHTQGSVPRHAGAKMLYRADGTTVGTIGGATLELAAFEDAKQAIVTGKPLLKTYYFNADEGSVGVCGGQSDVFIEPLRPEPTLLVWGCGHVGLALLQLAAQLDFKLIAVDDRPEFLTPDRLPPGTQPVHVPYQAEGEQLAPYPAAIHPQTYVVVATWGYDLPVLRQVLPTPAVYIGLVASRKKARYFFDRLLAEGFTVDDLKRVTTPAGLDIGAETPAELALSILAEIVMVRKGGSGRPLYEARNTARLLLPKES